MPSHPLSLLQLQCQSLLLQYLLLQYLLQQYLHQEPRLLLLQLRLRR